MEEPVQGGWAHTQNIFILFCFKRRKHQISFKSRTHTCNLLAIYLFIANVEKVQMWRGIHGEMGLPVLMKVFLQPHTKELQHCTEGKKVNEWFSQKICFIGFVFK